MRGGIEKKNYPLITGFTMYQVPSGAFFSFPLDSIIVLNINDLEYL